MAEELEQLIDSLLYEGYALYPYTPGAAKNATPTPFGIAYPPAYAAELTSTFDHLLLGCVLRSPADAQLDAEVRFLASSGERHEARAHTLALPGTSVGALAGAGAGEHGRLERRAEIDVHGAAALALTLSLTARELEAGVYELALRVENRTPCERGLARAAALTRSLLSTLPIVRVRGGRFVSPLERPCASVNTFPVLASAGDDAVLGAAIVLPDHPRIAPASRGGLFDSTEIEEALLLHVQALSDAERQQIEGHDPVVREMVARAAAATPADIIALHGGLTPVAAAEAAPATVSPAEAAEAAEPRSRVSEAPPQEPQGLVDPTAGQEEAQVDGVRFRRGGKVRISRPPETDLHARLLKGRVATIERIMIDYDGKAHLGVTIDGDPGQELLRESGRLLFFFAPEVEALQ